MSETFQDKTEPATDKKRQDAREKGQIAKTKELPSVLTFMAGLMLFSFASHPLLERLLQFMTESFSQSYQYSFTQENVYALLLLSLKSMALFLLPLFAIIFIAGLAGNVAQVGFLLTTQPLMPDFSRINPMKGLTRMFSKQALGELLKSVFKITLIGYVAYKTVMAEGDKFPGLINLGVPEIFTYTMQIIYKLGLRVGLVLLVLALFDYAFQRWTYERDLRMTKEEIKQEFKQREGDPYVKARIRSIQRQMARKRMMEAVPKANVVITNPTHYAIALEYRQESMVAPQVVAKGAGLIALKIKQIAQDNRIPLVEDKLLAQTLYKEVEIGDLIPANLYKAVAEILAYVYKLKRKF